MPELTELTERFGAVELELDCMCAACGTHIEDVIVETEGILCVDCGLPVLA